MRWAMDINSRAVDNTGDTAPEIQGSCKSAGFENVKNTIADRLHNVAGTLGEKAADAPSGKSQCRKRASEWLDDFAEYVRQFDQKQVDTTVREYVKKSPGRSLLIAGGIGLIIGVALRRR